MIECSHKEMQICGQGLHDSNLTWLCSHDGRHFLRRLIIDMKPGRKWRVRNGLEMPKHSLSGPC